MKRNISSRTQSSELKAMLGLSIPGHEQGASRLSEETKKIIEIFAKHYETMQVKSNHSNEELSEPLRIALKRYDESYRDINQQENVVIQIKKGFERINIINKKKYSDYLKKANVEPSSAMAAAKDWQKLGQDLWISLAKLKIAEDDARNK